MTRSVSPFAITAAAAEAPSRVGLVVDDLEYTYEELADHVRGAAGWLRSRGIVDGATQRVAVVGKNSAKTIALTFALVELGVPIVLLHPRLTEGERRVLVEDAAPDLLVLDCDGEIEPIPSAHTPAPLVPERALGILYTSGSTGRPKAALLSHRAFAGAVAASAANLGWTDSDRWLLSLPLAHVGGLSIMLRCVAARRCAVLDSSLGSSGRFDAEKVARVVHARRVTILSLVPTTLARMLDLPSFSPPSHVRAIFVGGAAASKELVARAWAARFPVMTTYGLTEACSQVATQRYGSPPAPVGTVGPVVQGMEVRIVDGRIQVRGSALFSGYLNRPSPFLEGGWFDTGDLGFFDDQGRLHLHGRRTDLIVSGGENVYPTEVEQELGRIRGVASACVFGVDDPVWGQKVAAAIVPERGELTPEDVRQHCKAHLAPYKRPRLIAILRELPTTAAGKVDRARSRDVALPMLRPVPADLPEALT